jgi:acetamidase/formamidase
VKIDGPPSSGTVRRLWKKEIGDFSAAGRLPGDTLKVHIDKITLNRNWGWGGAMPYFGALAPK